MKPDQVVLEEFKRQSQMRRLILRAWHSLRGEIAFGFLVASVFWAAVRGWQAAYAPTDAEKQKCYEAAHNTGQKNEECKSLWEKTTSDPVAFFTLVLAISTIGLWVATVFLYRAREKQFQHARRSAASQSRDMRASIAEAKKSADAAMLAVGSERAWLSFEKMNTITSASGFRIEYNGEIQTPDGPRANWRIEHSASRTP